MDRRLRAPLLALAALVLSSAGCEDNSHGCRNESYAGCSDYWYDGAECNKHWNCAWQESCRSFSCTMEGSREGCLEHRYCEWIPGDASSDPRSGSCQPGEDEPDVS